MKYYKISPSVALQPYIMCYYVWEHQQPLVSPLEINSPPNGLGGMVFNYGDPPYLLKNDGTWDRIPSCFVAGQFTRNYTLLLRGTVGMIGVVFWPVGLSYVLHMPMIEFTDQRVDLQLIFNEEAASLANRLLECQTTYSRIQVLEKFMLDKIHKLNPEPDIVDYAVKAIIHKKGILSIGHLSDDLCISSRQLRRRFTEKVGISPKMCARIKRFNYVSNLSSGDFGTWMDKVHSCGYYDQAHFIRDVSDFSGRNPTEYRHYQHRIAQVIGAA